MPPGRQRGAGRRRGRTLLRHPLRPLRRQPGRPRAEAGASARGLLRRGRAGHERAAHRLGASAHGGGRRKLRPGHLRRAPAPALRGGRLIRRRSGLLGHPERVVRPSPVPLLGVAALALVAAGCSSSAKHAAVEAKPPRASHVARVKPRPTRLVEHSLGTLAQPLQDAAAARSGSGALLLGGLNAADTSVAEIRFVSARGDTARGSLPGVRHDAAAVSLGGAAYVFGGGNGPSQLDEIVKVGPAGRTSVVGRLPQPASDVSAAVPSGTAYVVGGFTGARWLNTILAWNPGGPPRVAARLPVALRYAAVTTARGKLVIAGGSIPSGRRAGPCSRSIPSAGGSGRSAGCRRNHARRRGDAERDRLRDRRPRLGRGHGDGAHRRNRSLYRSQVGRFAGRAPFGSRRGERPRGDPARRGPRAWRNVVLDRQARSAGRSTRHCRVCAEVGLRTNVYAADAAGELAPRPSAPARSSTCPNSQSDSVDEIDPSTYRVVRQFSVGALPQHVDAVVRPADALRDQRPGQQPHPDRSGQRPARPSDPGGGSLQHVLHSGRPLRDRGGGAPRAPRLPRSPHHAPAPSLQRARAPASTTSTSPPTAVLVASCEFSARWSMVDVAERGGRACRSARGRCRRT